MNEIFTCFQHRPVDAELTGAGVLLMGSLVHNTSRRDISVVMRNISPQYAKPEMHGYAAQISAVIRLQLISGRGVG